MRSKWGGTLRGSASESSGCVEKEGPRKEKSTWKEFVETKTVGFRRGSTCCERTRRVKTRRERKRRERKCMQRKRWERNRKETKRRERKRGEGKRGEGKRREGKSGKESAGKESAGKESQGNESAGKESAGKKKRKMKDAMLHEPCTRHFLWNRQDRPIVGIRKLM